MLQNADGSSRALPRQRFLGLAASGVAALTLEKNPAGDQWSSVGTVQKYGVSYGC